MSKHTPGPWRAVPPSGGHGWQIEVPVGLRSFYLAEIVEHNRDKEDAALIAAAPDMEDALGDAAAVLVGVPGAKDVYDKVCAALEKAGVE